jgi:SAM-dependent methyltransferase
MSLDQNTADAFATSWNNVGEGSVYTPAQAIDWFEPLSATDFKDKTVAELGCGNASLLLHVMGWGVCHGRGVDLGASVQSAQANLARAGIKNCDIVKGDLTSYRGELSDLVYCIGVLHHLKSPSAGFESVLENTKQGGKFHCWVYAYEGNAVVRWLVDPIRLVACHLPWWLTKYGLATPLALPFYLYAKALRAIGNTSLAKAMPLGEYAMWIAQRGFAFFRHVAFDQLVTPQTAYIKRAQVEAWLADERVAPGSSYIIMRNGNSWKFGGKRL